MGSFCMKKHENFNESIPRKEDVSICTQYHGAIELIGKRWTGMIIYHLLSGPKRYHELLAEIHGISDRLLTERLRELEVEGIVVKKVSTSSPRKVEYELTAIGQDLDEVINAIVKWVKTHRCLNS